MLMVAMDYKLEYIEKRKLVMAFSIECSDRLTK